MVWRDLDITVVVPRLSVEQVGALGLWLATPSPGAASDARNDTGS